MKRILWLTLGVIGVIVFAAGNPGFKHPNEFTLAASGHSESGDPASTSFSLAQGVAASMALAGPGGGGYIEDFESLFRTALGWDALHSNTTGSGNTAIGWKALYSNTSGTGNTAVGMYVLYANTEGGYNTACGLYSLDENTTGSGNTASGYGALIKNNGLRNTAYGVWALGLNTTGIHNTALGDNAGYSCREGNYNIYLGGEVQGGFDDTNTIRIGLPYDPNQTPTVGQNQTYIAGIVESPFTPGDAPSVVGIRSDGRVGTMASDLLPSTGPQGPAGEGLISGSLLFLVSGATPPDTGYTLVGTYPLTLTAAANKKPAKLTVNVYQKL